MSDLDPRVAELLSAVEKAPQDEASWDELEDLAAELQRPDEVGAAYRKALSPGLAPEHVERLGQRALGFHEEWFGEESPHLVDVLERILGLDPGLGWALNRITVLFTVKERWAELLAHFDRAVLAAGDDTYRKTSLLEEAAQLAKDFANQPERAIGYLAQLLDLRPHDAQLFASLERLLEREGRHADLVELWRRKLDGNDASVLRLRIAETYLDKLADPRAALVEATALVEAGDAHAVAIAERVLVHPSAAHEVRREALQLLREQYDAAGRAGDVERALGTALSFETKDGAIALHRELAQRIAARGDAKAAFAHAASLLALDPGDSAAADFLAELAVRAEDPVAHAEALERAAEAATGSRRVALALDAADVRAGAAGDAAGAEAAYRRVLELPDAGQSVRLEVARKLSALLEHPERRSERLAALEGQAAIERDPAEKRRVLGVVASLATELEAFERALDAWGKRLALDPTDVDALDARIAIYRRTGQCSELVTSLRARLALTTASAVRRALALDIASVLDGQLGDVPSAIEAYEAFASEFGEEPVAVDALTRLYAAAARSDAQEAILSRAVKNDADRAVDVLVRLAEVKRARGGEPADAGRELLRALRLDPSNRAAREGLTALLGEPSTRGIAAEGLADAALQTDDVDEILRLLPTRIESADSTRVKVRLLREAAELHEKRRGDAASAFAAIASAIALTPSDESLERELVRLAEASGRFADAGTTLSDAASRVEEPSRAAEIFRTASRLRVDRAADAAGALQDSLAAFRLVPRDRATTLEVVRLAAIVGDVDAAAEAWVAHAFAMRAIDLGVTTSLEDAGERVGWDKLLSALEKQVASAVRSALATSGAPHLRSVGLADLARDLENKLASYHRDRRADEPGSMAALSRALEHDPGHTDTLRELARLQWHAPGRPLVDTLLSLSDRLVGDLDALYDAARIATDPVGDLVLAREVLERLFREATRLWRRGERARGERPAERSALDAHAEIVRLELAASRFERAIDWLIEGSRLPIDPNEARGLLRRAADIAREKLGDETRALKLYQQVIDDSLEDGEAVDRVAAIYEARGRVPELLALRRRELDLPLEAERRLGVRLEVARLLGVLEDKGGRLDVLRANLAELPGHEASIQELSAVLEAKGRSIELHDLLSTQAKRLEEQDAARASRLWSLAARVAEDRLHDQERAIAAYRRVVTLAPSADAYDALARLHMARGEAGQAAEWLERRLDSTQGRERIDLYVRLAEARLAAGRNDRAAIALERALAEAPESFDVRERLAKIYRDQKSYEPLARLLSDGALRTSDAEHVLAYAKEAAILYRDEVGHLERAIPVLEHASQAGVLDHETRSCLAEAYRIAGKLPEARAVLESLVADFGRRRSPERALVHFQLARVAHAAGDLKEALDQLDKASSMDMGHTGILRMQGQLAREAGQADRSERAFRALLLVVRRQPADAEGIEVGPSEVLYELARLAGDRGQETQAKELLESAREAARHSMNEAARFTKVLLARADLPLAEEMIALRAAHEGTTAQRAQVLFDKATLLDRQGSLAESLRARLEAIELAPDSRGELDASRDLARRAQASSRFAEALVAVAEKLRRKEDALVASDLLFRAGQAFEEDAGDLAKASEAYQRVEVLGARSVDAWRALGRVAGKRGDRVEEIRVLRRLVAAGVDTTGLEEGDIDEGARTDALYRIAEVELRSDDTLESGLDTLRDAVKRDADHARAARIAADAAKLAPDHEGLLLFWERAARDANDSEILLAFLRHRIERGGASLDEVQEGVTLATALGDDAAVDVLLLKGAEVAEGSLGGLAGALWIPTTLAERRAASGDVPGAIAWTQRAADAADAAGDPERALELLRTVAELASSTDAALAVKAYDRLIERSPADRSLWAPLAATHAALRDRDGYELAVRVALDGIADRDERNALRLALAEQLLTTYAAEADGVAVLREVLDEDPDHLAASERLLDIFQKNGENEALAELLERQLDRARDRSDVEAIAALSLRRGSLLEPTRRDDAMDAYRSALDWAPEDVRLLAALYRLYGPSDDAHDRAALGERLLAVASASDAAPLALQLADAYLAVEDDDAVGRVLEVGFRKAPSDATLRGRYEAWLTQRGDRDGLAEAIAFDASHRTDATRTARFREAAAVFVEVGRPERAAEILGEAVTASPSDLGLLREYVEALVASGRASDGVPLVGVALEQSEGAARATLLAMRAHLATAEGDTGSAVADLEEASRVAKEHTPALVEALEAHRARVESIGDGDEERRVTLRLVAVTTAIGSTERAREVLAYWTSRDTTDALALRTLRDLDVAAGRFDDALVSAERLVEIEQAEAQVDAALKLHDIATRASNPAAARAGLERVFQDQPDQKPVRDALRAMYESTESFAELAQLLLADAAEASAEGRFEALRRAGEILVYKVGDAAGAVQPVREALALREDDGDTIVLLADAYMGADALAEAVELLNEAINAKGRKRGPALAGMQLRMARIAGLSGDAQTQLEWLKVALETDKGNNVVAAELAELAIALGDDATAMQALKIVTLQKTPGPMTKAVAFLRQAQIAQRQGDHQKAVLWARRARIEDAELAEAEQFLASLGEG